jgi:integrase
MGRTLGRLSALEARKAREGMHADGGGLYLQVTSKDARSWIFRYAIDGRERYMGLGSCNDFSLAEARERARSARQLLADGFDPIETRLSDRDKRRADEAARITFKEAAEKFITVHEANWKNPKHRLQWRNSLKDYAYGTLGNRPVSAVDGALISQALASIWTTKAETARRVKQRIERVVQWVKDGMPLPAPGKAKRVKHHKAMPYTELPEFMAELRDRNSLSAKALEFTVLTVARTNETIGARWDEIDLPGKVWTIPAARMKAGKEHRVPLSERAIQILKGLPHKAHGYVFSNHKKPLSNMAMLEMVRGMLGKGATVHGFRSTFTDWAHERTSYPKVVVDMALAHAIGDKVEAAYRRGDLFDKRKRLMADWARYCEQQASNGRVVALRA